MKHTTQKGFTLLEILLVIAAIGILAAIVIVAINPQRQIAQVRNADRDISVNTLRNALNQYLIEEGSFPASISTTEKEICAQGVAEATCNTSGLAYLGALAPQYLASIPREPQTSGNGAGYRVYTNNAGNRIYVKAGQTEVVNCPAGYIAVPGNPLYGTQDFCVMKYEAKAVGGQAVSQAAETPWVSINQTTARTACQNVGGRLMNLRERQTIARNLEGVGSNWSGGSVGSGSLWRGHSDNAPAGALAASTNDADGYSGTGNVAPSVERRTHTLSNGQVIWDMSGNVYEWLDDIILGQEKPNNASGAFWQEWTVFNTGGTYGTLSYDLIRPSNSTWNSTQGVGQYIAGTVTGTTSFAVLSGGDWNSGAIAGLFGLRLWSEPSFTNTAVGFRCSLSPGV